MRYTVYCVMYENRVLTNLRKGLVEYCVLAAAEVGPTYGFELARNLKADGLAASESTLYPLLARLRTNGMLESDWRESEAGRPRKYYTLTPAGRDSLAIFRSTWPPLRDAVDRAIGKDEP